MTKKPNLKFSSLYKYPYKRGSLMQISINGIRSKKTKKLVKKAAEFYATLLMTKRMVESIELNIEFRNKLDDDAEGYCQYLDNYGGVKSFEIELEKYNPIDSVLTTLAHEMVHLKQFATNELSNSHVPAHISKWQGRSVNEKLVDYWDLPWEIEAHGREKGLFFRFCDRVDIYK